MLEYVRILPPGKESLGCFGGKWNTQWCIIYRIRSLEWTIQLPFMVSAPFYKCAENFTLGRRIDEGREVFGRVFVSRIYLTCSTNVLGSVPTNLSHSKLHRMKRPSIHITPLKETDKAAPRTNSPDTPFSSLDTAHVSPPSLSVLPQSSHAALALEDGAEK